MERIPRELQEAARRVQAGETVQTSVRTLLSWFGAQRRGYNNVARVRQALGQLGFTTTPSFEDVWIDAPIELRTQAAEEPVGDDGASRAEAASPSLDEEVVGRQAHAPGSDGRGDEGADPTVTSVEPPLATARSPLDGGVHEGGARPAAALQGAALIDETPAAVGALNVRREVAEAPSLAGDAESTIAMLPSANLRLGLCTVHEADSIVKAISLMSARDFSQVPVLRGPSYCVGVVTWRSIGRYVATRGRMPVTVGEGVEHVRIHPPHAHLFEVVADVVRDGCVLVRGHNNNLLQGIVTVSDLAGLFGQQLEPFVLVGEIERGLRSLLRRALGEERITLTGTAPVEAAPVEDLTIGAMKRLLENPANWQRLGLPLDRAVFVSVLDGVRETRNDLMHFAPEPFEPGDLQQLRDFARLVRELLQEHVGAPQPAAAAH